MATATITRDASSNASRFGDPALLVPIVGAGVLIYLAVLPLFMLVVGSFQAEVAPPRVRLYAQKLSNRLCQRIHLFDVHELVHLCSGRRRLHLYPSDVLAWLTERTNTPLRAMFVPIAVIPLILPGVLESIAWIFFLSPKFGYLNVWLMNLFGLHLAAIQRLLPARHDMGALRRPSAVGISDDDRGIQVHGPVPGRVGDDVRCNAWQTFKPITLRLLVPTAGSVLLILFVRTLESFETPALVGIPARIYVYTSEIFPGLQRVSARLRPRRRLGGGLTVVKCRRRLAVPRPIGKAKNFKPSPVKLSGRRQFELGAWRWAGLAFLMGYFIFVVLLPFFVLFWASFSAVFRDSEMGCPRQADSRKLPLLDRLSARSGMR